MTDTPTRQQYENALNGSSAFTDGERYAIIRSYVASLIRERDAEREKVEALVGAAKLLVSRGDGICSLTDSQRLNAALADLEATDG